LGYSPCFTGLQAHLDLIQSISLQSISLPFFFRIGTLIQNVSGLQVFLGSWSPGPQDLVSTKSLFFRGNLRNTEHKNSRLRDLRFLNTLTTGSGIFLRSNRPVEYFSSGSHHPGTTGKQVHIVQVLYGIQVHIVWLLLKYRNTPVYYCNTGTQSVDLQEGRPIRFHSTLGILLDRGYTVRFGIH